MVEEALHRHQRPAHGRHVDVRGRHQQPVDGRGQLPRVLAELDHHRLRPWRQGRGAQAEHAGRAGRAVAQPGGRALEAAVLDQPLEQLGLGLLRRQVVLLGLAGEQQAHLDLQQRRHQHQKLAGRLQVELALLVRALDVGDHDLGDRHVGQLDLLAQHQRQQQVERPLEHVQVQLKIGQDHRRILGSRSDAGRLERYGRIRPCPPSPAHPASMTAGISAPCSPRTTRPLPSWTCSRPTPMPSHGTLPPLSELGGPELAELLGALGRLRNRAKRLSTYAELRSAEDAADPAAQDLGTLVAQRMPGIQDALRGFQLAWLDLPDDRASQLAELPEVAGDRHLPDRVAEICGPHAVGRGGARAVGARRRRRAVLDPALVGAVVRPHHHLRSGERPGPSDLQRGHVRILGQAARGAPHRARGAA